MTGRLVLASQRAIPGGAQRSLAATASGLAARGWEVVGVVGEDGWLAEHWRARSLPVAPSVVAAAEEHGPVDAVVSMGAATHAWAGADAARLGIPAAWWLELTLRGRPAEAAALATPAWMAAAPTEAAADALRARAPGLAVATVAPGVDPGDVAAHRRAGPICRASLPTTSTSGSAVGPAVGPVVAVVGRLDPIKGQDVAIEAVARLAARHPGVHLVLVGGAIVGHEGDLEAQLATQAAALPGRVTLVGHVDDAGPWLAAADVVAVPSLHEAFGLVVVEALAVGTPVVASDVDGPRAILDGGRFGELVAPGDADALAVALDRLLDDPARRAELARRGPARAAAFAPVAAAAAWDALLQR